SRIIKAHDGLFATRVALRATAEDDDRRLQDLVCSVVHPDLHAVDGAIRIQRSTGRALQLLVSPLHSRDAVLGVTGSAVVFISDPDTSVESLDRALQRLYELTPTESRVTTCLAEGMSIQEAADVMRVEVSTARSH